MSKIVEPFNLVGKLSGFVIKDGIKIKYLRVIVSDREYWIQPPKEPKSLMFSLQPESWLEITGTKKIKGGKLKLYAEEIQLVSDANFASSPVTPSSHSPKRSILVCQGSDCLQRGGGAVCDQVAQNLQAQGLEDAVQVRMVGCLKRCKMGPNLVMLPDKTYYSHVQVSQIPDLMKAHFQNPITNG